MYSGIVVKFENMQLASIQKWFIKTNAILNNAKVIKWNIRTFKYFCLVYHVYLIHVIHVFVSS